MNKKINIKPCVKIEVDTEYIEHSHTAKHYNLLVNGKKVEVLKWWDDGEDDGYDCDYEIGNEAEVKKSLSENEWDELTDYILELK